MNVKKNMANRFVQMYILFLCIIGIGIFVIPFEMVTTGKIFSILMFGINGAIWTALLFKEVKKRAFSCQMMHWFFCLLFFCFAAMVQYINDDFPWVGCLDENLVQKINAILLIWTIGVLVGTKIGKRKSVVKFSYGPIVLNKKRKVIITFEKKKSKIYALTILSALICLFRIQTVGIENLFSRATSSVSLSENGSLSMLISHGMEAISCFIAILSVYYYKKTKKDFLALVLNILFLLISYFPTGLSRYAAAVIYLGLLIVISDGMKSKRLFPVLFLGGFLVVLPFLNAFRNNPIQEVDFAKRVKNILVGMSTEWLAGDYDAYTMLGLTIEHVERVGILFGKQMLGALLFWVPRTIWPGKPVGSGYTVADELGWNFKNLSCPLPGEGYINGGLIGMFLFAILIGFLFEKLDRWYWDDMDRACKYIRLADLIYPVVMIFVFFISRGDLMSSFAYLVAYIVMGGIIAVFMKN